MPTVEVTENLSSPVEVTWRLICDEEAYRRMGPVRSLDVLVDEGDRMTTRWEIELKGSILVWEQREHRDALRRRIEFHQLDGDLERFDGYWQLTERPDGSTDACLSVDFEIGIPMLRDMLDPVASRAIRENSRKMLLSLAPQAAS